MAFSVSIAGIANIAYHGRGVGWANLSEGNVDPAVGAST